jgi:hypothetical protein
LGDWGASALAELGDGEGAEAGVAGDVVGGAAEGDGLAGGEDDRVVLDREQEELAAVALDHVSGIM